MRYSTLVLLAGSIVLGPAVSNAAAQNERKFGLVIGYPSTVGVEWQANSRVAIQADAGFERGRLEQVSTLTFGIAGGPTSTTTTKNTHGMTRAGVSALITVRRNDQLRLYLVPRVGWQQQRSAFETEADADDVFFLGIDRSSQNQRSSITTNGVETSGMFGANYRLSGMFSVFGEAGIGFSRPTVAVETAQKLTSYEVGSQSRFGVVIHF